MADEDLFPHSPIKLQDSQASVPHILPRGEKEKNSGSEIPYVSNQERQQKLKRIVREKAFDGHMKKKIWKIRGKKDLHLLFKDQKNHIKRTINMFVKAYTTAMFHIIVSLSMYKQSDDNRRNS